jgi:diguanylate cyclase (GGDEF)-like protein/PAS domain S-box-containing protein
MLLRFASFLLLLLFSFANPAFAESRLDVGAMGSSMNLAPYLQRLTTEKPEVLVELPRDATGKVGVIALKSSRSGPSYQWMILTLVNTTKAQKNLIVVIDHQKFAGSRLVYPLIPGSVVASVAHTGTVAPAKISALGQDAYSVVLEPSTALSLGLEMTAEPPSAMLWERDAFDSLSRSIAFFRGAILGVAVLLSLSMLLLYTTRARASFLSGGIFALASVAFVAMEAGYFAQARKLFLGLEVSPAEARAVIESVMSVGLLLCLTALADLRRTVPVLRNIFVGLALVGAALPVYAFVDPLLVSAIARIAFAIIVILGFIILFRLRQLRPAESALLLWSTVVIWTFMATMAAFSKGGSAYISSALLLGLIVVLIFLTFRFAQSAASTGLLSRRLFQEAGRRGLALAGAQQYVWDWQPEDQSLFVSEELEQALGHQPGTLTEATADSLLDIMHPADRVAYLATVENAERRGRGLINQELRLRRGDGTYRWFELRARAMAGSDNRMVRSIGTLSDITNAKRTEERLLSDAVYDRITGLPNRALFMDRLKREIAKPNSENLHVILVDIDRFKTVNDGLGHDAGDSLLTVLGRRIESLIGSEDTVARLPGDQFAVLFSDSGQRRDIKRFTDSLRLAIAKPVNVNQQEIFMTACLGAASRREGGSTAEQLMKDAAIALYEAKRRGKEMIEFFRSSMRDNRGELVALEAELRRALERNEIEVHYQPIARLSDMDLAGFEALVRWRHPTLGLLAPESFLGLAEQTGMIKDIGRFVLNEATRQLGIWQRAFRPSEPVFMAVNVSASQLLDTDLVADIRAAVTRETVFRQTLKIEVTESAVMQYPEKSASLLELVRQLGVGLACDDFGTGYSSLSSLRHLPFDTLKVDRSFVSPEAEDEKAAIILQSIVSLAHDLGLTIVAEGIEDQGQVDRLVDLECDYGQGFFIGQPMTAKQVGESLTSMPYAKGHGRTAMSNLWERATHEPVPVPVETELTVDAIEHAEQLHENAEPTQSPEWQAIKAVALAIQAQKPGGMSPPPGSSPMAPRLVRSTLEELPSIPPSESKPEKKPKKKTAAKRKQAAKKESPEASGVA